MIIRLKSPAAISSSSSSPSSRSSSQSNDVPFVTREYDLSSLPPHQKRRPFFSEEEDPPPPSPPDFALAAIHEALEDGWKFDLVSFILLMGEHEEEGGGRRNSKGADEIVAAVVVECTSTTTIPLQAGCSSSTAFCVAWIQVLSVLSGNSSSLTALDVAKLAHRAEVTHFGLPGGTMDHVTIAVGGLLRIGGSESNDNPWSYETLVSPLPSMGGLLGAWVVGDSGEPKDTFQHLRRCKTDRLLLLERLGGDWDRADAEGFLSESEKVLLNATRTNRDTEAQAAVELLLLRSREGLHKEKGNDDDKNLGKRLGSLMNRHHGALRDGLGLSTDRIESMREAALGDDEGGGGGGTWGFKIVGSGGGGCAVAWTSSDTAERVADTMLRAGAARTWIVRGPGGGARIVFQTPRN
jgi:galactokinase